MNKDALEKMAVCLETEKVCLAETSLNWKSRALMNEAIA